MKTNFIFDLQRFDYSFLDTLKKDSDDNYLIKTVEDLQGLAVCVNNGGNCASYCFKLAPVDKDGKSIDTLDLSSIDNWTPIGTATNKFSGSLFDGNGKTIKNLKITGNNDYVGLFGYLDGGEIQNINLENVNINGKDKVGGIVGYNDGTIKNCKVSGKINGTSEVGGIVGLNHCGSVSGNTNVSTVTGTSNVGSVVGHNEENASNQSGAVSNNNYYKSNENLEAIGHNTGTDNNNTPLYRLTLPEGVTDIKVAGEKAFTETDTTNKSVYVYAKENEEVTFTYSATDKFFKVSDVPVTGTGSDTYKVTMTAENTKVETTSNFLETLTQDGNNNYLIKTADDLKNLAKYVNSGTGDKPYTCEGVTFKLANDIDLSKVDNFTPIGRHQNGPKPFKGTFDGDNKTISGLKITNDGDNVGLFGYFNGTVKDVNLTDVKISGDMYVGGVVGSNYGTVSGCKISGEVIGNTEVGGIVGQNSDGTVENCEISGTVKGNEKVSNNNNIGGVVGINSGTVKGCKNISGTVPALTKSTALSPITAAQSRVAITAAKLKALSKSAVLLAGTTAAQSATVPTVAQSMVMTKSAALSATTKITAHKKAPSRIAITAAKLKAQTMSVALSAGTTAAQSATVPTVAQSMVMTKSAALSATTKITAHKKAPSRIAITAAKLKAQTMSVALSAQTKVRVRLRIPITRKQQESTALTKSAALSAGTTAAISKTVLTVAQSAVMKRSAVLSAITKITTNKKAPSRIAITAAQSAVNQVSAALSATTKMFLQHSKVFQTTAKSTEQMMTATLSAL